MQARNMMMPVIPPPMYFISGSTGGSAGISPVISDRISKAREASLSAIRFSVVVIKTLIDWAAVL